MSIDDQIRSIVREELARLGTIAVYSTEREALFPPGKHTRRAARDAIRAAGGECIGRGRATVWTVERERYHAHHGRAPLRIVQTSSDEAIAARALRGTRATRTA